MSGRNYAEDIGKKTHPKLPNYHASSLLSLPETIKNFLAEFCTNDEEGNKIFKYAVQLTRLAHREQVNITIDMDDLADYNESLALAIQQNTRRYANFFANVIQEMLPNYKVRTKCLF